MLKGEGKLPVCACQEAEEVADQEGTRQEEERGRREWYCGQVDL